MAEKLGAAEKSLSKFIPFLPFLFSLSPGEILPGNYYPNQTTNEGAGSSTEGTTVRGSTHQP